MLIKNIKLVGHISLHFVCILKIGRKNQVTKRVTLKGRAATLLIPLGIWKTREHRVVNCNLKRIGYKLYACFVVLVHHNCTFFNCLIYFWWYKSTLGLCQNVAYVEICWYFKNFTCFKTLSFLYLGGCGDTQHCRCDGVSRGSALRPIGPARRSACEQYSRSDHH